MRKKTEEYEQLKIENQDLKQFIKLGETLQLDFSICYMKFQSQEQFMTHIKNIHIKEQINCKLGGEKQ